MSDWTNEWMNENENVNEWTLFYSVCKWIKTEFPFCVLLRCDVMCCIEMNIIIYFICLNFFLIATHELSHAGIQSIRVSLSAARLQYQCTVSVKFCVRAWARAYSHIYVCLRLQCFVCNIFRKETSKMRVSTYTCTIHTQCKDPYKKFTSCSRNNEHTHRERKTHKERKREISTAANENNGKNAMQQPKRTQRENSTKWGAMMEKMKKRGV